MCATALDNCESLIYGYFREPCSGLTSNNSKEGHAHLGSEHKVIVNQEAIGFVRM